MASSQIPYATEQGIFKCVSGNFFRGTGKFNQAIAKPLNCGLTPILCVIAPSQSARQHVRSTSNSDRIDAPQRFDAKCHSRPLAGSLNHLVGAAEQRNW